jgi:hypothetical protein
MCSRCYQTIDAVGASGSFSLKCYGHRMRICPLLLALASCGGKLATQEPAGTLDGSAGPVSSPGPDGGATEAAAAPDDGSKATSEGGAVAVAEICPEACTGGCDGGTCMVACGQPCPYSTATDVTYLQCLPTARELIGGGAPPAACQTSAECPPGRPCQIACAGNAACQGRSLICPNDAPCKVICSGISGCQGEKIVCPSNAPCEIICNGVAACQGAAIQCPTSASCTVECSGLACGGNPPGNPLGTLTCGKGPCTATCTDPGSGFIPGLIVVGCNDSASCHNNGCPSN